MPGRSTEWDGIPWHGPAEKRTVAELLREVPGELRETIRHLAVTYQSAGLSIRSHWHGEDLGWSLRFGRPLVADLLIGQDGPVLTLGLEPALWEDYCRRANPPDCLRGTVKEHGILQGRYWLVWSITEKKDCTEILPLLLAKAAYRPARASNSTVPPDARKE